MQIQTTLNELEMLILLWKPRYLKEWISFSKLFQNRYYIRFVAVVLKTFLFF